MTLSMRGTASRALVLAVLGWGGWPVPAPAAPRPAAHAPAAPVTTPEPATRAPVAPPAARPLPAAGPSAEPGGAANSRAPAAPAPRPAAVRVIAEDGSGVTLRLDFDHWDISPPGRDGRSYVSAPGMRMLESVGRPQLPYLSTLLALPPGARIGAALVSGSSESVDSVHATITPKNGFEADRSALRYHPVLTPVAPIEDGIWPVTDVTVGEPFTLRGQRIAAVEFHPFRYDVATGKLRVRRSMTVRVSFLGATEGALPAAAPADRFIEPVLRGALLNYDQGRTFRTARALPARAPGRFDVGGPHRAGASGIGFDEGQTEVRVKLDSTGVWALDFDDLAAAGFPAGVPDSEVTVHRHEFLPDQTPPYGTIEIPAEIEDYNGNGIFDSGDQIVVYVQDWASRSGASLPQRHWGDAEVVYVSYLPGRAALRVGSRAGAPSQPGLTPLASYPNLAHFEHNTGEFFTFPPDTLTDLFLWTSYTTYYDRPDSIQFETNQIDTTHSAVVHTQLVSRKTDLHFMFGAVKNRLGQMTTMFDSTSGYFAGSKTVDLSAAVTGSALSEGRFNHLVLWGKSDPSAPDPNVNSGTGAVLNWFEVTYWRRFQPLHDYLTCNSADAAGPFELLASSFSDSTFLRAWDVTDPQNPRRMDGAKLEPSSGAWAVRFQDDATAGRRSYVVFQRPKAPPTDHYIAVTRRSLESHPVVDYLLITPEAFLPAVQPLVDLRESEGLHVLVAPLESINDEYNGGRHADFAVKRFIRDAYYRWGARFVLLLGDGAAEDPQNQLGGSTPDWIPAHLVLGPVGIFVANANPQEIVPSDNWYVWCIDDAGCPDPANQPKVLDLYVGRLPVNSVTDAQNVIDKLVKYENVSPNDLWRRRIELQSDDDFSGENLFGGSATYGYCQRDYERIFVTLNQDCRSVIVDQAGLRLAEPEVFNLGDYMGGLQLIITPPPCPTCQADTCRADRDAAQTLARSNFTPRLFTRLNDGRLWWNYQGHANEQLLSHESFYVSNQQNIDDTQNFTNDGKPFLFSAFSCHANNFGRRWERGLNSFAPGDCLGASMITLPSDRGAIASWASSGFELVPTNPDDHLNVEMTRDLFSTPPRDPDLGDRGARVVLGEAIALTLLRWQNSPSAGLGERQVGVTYTLLGDPATRLSIGSPQALVTANGDTVQNDVPVRLHTFGDTLTLDADLVSNQQITQLSLTSSLDGASPVVIPPAAYTLVPAFGDTATGGRRYHLTYGTNLTANSFEYTFHTLDREGTPGLFDVLMPFQCVLRAEGVPINDGDPVAPTANLSLLVVSPAPVHPGSDLTLTINGQAIAFDSTLVAADPTGRQWILTWSHGPYPIDSYNLRLATSTGGLCTHRFRVDVGGGELHLQNTLAFPNPFDDDRGTQFSFTLVSGAPSDVLIRVYTLAGRLVFSRTERQLLPGYHQLAWDGRDAEGSTLANGIYAYKLVATNGTSSASHEGRLVKLRRPHHSDTP